MKKISRKMAALLAVGLLCLTAGALAAQDSPADYISLVEGVQVPSRQGLDVLTLEEVMERFGVPGMSVAVIRDFEVHWAKGYGTADMVTGAPVDTETLFQAASISKPVTAMAALTAVQEDLFSLDDDINSILRSWTLPGGGFTGERPVTPRLLFSHTAGLGDGHGFPGYEPDAPRPTPVQIFEGEPPSNVGPVELVRPPLTAMHYSGGGTTIMQLALTDARGVPFPDLMRRTVLEPVGMTRSTFEQPLPPALDTNAARGHRGDGLPMGLAEVARVRGPGGGWAVDHPHRPGPLCDRGADGGPRRPGPGAVTRERSGNVEPGRRGLVRGRLAHRAARPGLVLQPRRRQLGLRVLPDGPQGQGLRRGGDDQFLRGRRALPGGARTGRARLRLGLAGQAGAAVVNS